MSNTPIIITKILTISNLYDIIKKKSRSSVMKNYVNAELEVIKLDEQDVVATSGG